MEKEGAGQNAPHSEEYLQAHTAVVLVDYDPEWPRTFRNEAEKIRRTVGERALRLEHVGSTSIPNLPAKPIIDIVLVVPDSAKEEDYAGALEKAGFQLRIREPAWYEHRLFTGSARRVNLHVFSAACPEVDRMLAFRDWLRKSDADRELYARTKRALAQQNWKCVQNYADAKTAVIVEIMSRARSSAPPGSHER